MTTYPVRFSANSNALAGIATPWMSSSGEARSLECSIPKEFGGPSSGFSPEDLYIFALASCYIATFKVIAANSKLVYESILADAVLTLDRDAGSPMPWMKQAVLSFTLHGATDEAKARRLMERVSKQCMIINSVKTDVHFNFEVVTA